MADAEQGGRYVLDQEPGVVPCVPPMPPAGAYLVAQIAATLLASDRVERRIAEGQSYRYVPEAMTDEQAVAWARSLVSEASAQMRGEAR
jgi:hypothetical protein